MPYYNSKRDKLVEKLKPDPKQRAGKVGPCERCGLPDCEYITVNYQSCPRCDGTVKYSSTQERANAFDQSAQIDLGWADEDTDPGGWFTAYVKPKAPKAPARAYICQTCKALEFYSPDDVADGQRCMKPQSVSIRCDGPLKVYP